MSPFPASAPLVCPRPSRLPKTYSVNLHASDPALIPVLRKSATVPLCEENENVVDILENADPKNLETGGEADNEAEQLPLDAQSTATAREPEDLALTELLEIISNRPSFHTFSKTAVTTPAYAEYPAIPRHHSSFEPRRPAKKGHAHSYSLGRIIWSTNTDEFEWHRGQDTPTDLAEPSPSTEEDEDEGEDAAEVLDALIADLQVARSPSMSTPISASPIPRTQNPMPCNSPFFALPADNAIQGPAGVMAPELYLPTGSSLVQGLLARQKALNTAAGGRFVGVC